jgi:phage internal scaffolding protein
MSQVIEVRANGTRRVKTINDFPEKRAQQHQKDDCNINIIMERVAKREVVPLNLKSPAYGDFSNVPDFQEANNRLIQAKEEFMKVPAKVRKKFNNDEGEFIAFVNNPENMSELLEMGLVEKVRPDPVEEMQKSLSAIEKSLSKEEA